MMKDSLHIIEDLKIVAQQGELPKSIASIHYDSRKVGQGDLFVAIRGSQADGHDYIERAIKQGATIVVCESSPNTPYTEDACIIQVENSRQALASMAAAYYEHPSRHLQLVGVTGTNGKTSIATLLYRLFSQMGYVCGLLSTIENKIGQDSIAATHTTPDPLAINALIQKMTEAGCHYCFMEVSSHALDQDRVSQLDFDGAIFTNLSHDHLDYHHSFANYIKAKKRFFDELKPSAFALTNTDDKNGMVMLQNCKAKTYTYALQQMADYKTKVIEMQWDGALLSINGQEMWSRLTGRFNAYNMTAIYGAAMCLQQDSLEVLQQLSSLHTAAGRFQICRAPDGRTAIIDYAHTPDALENVLQTIVDIKTTDCNIITVVGAGGNRDSSKRPLLAQIAASYSWRCILTSDNPRKEDPTAIIDEMAQGLSAPQQAHSISITDREEAIKTAALLATPQDVILIAGKGHETYQEIDGVRHHFDDTEIINTIFNATKR